MPDALRLALAAAALGLLACAGNHDGGAGSGHPPEEASMTETAPSRTALVARATARILSDAPAAGEWPVLLSVGPGSEAAAVAAELRRALGGDPRVRFSEAAKRPAPPVPDPSVPGGHVHAVEWTVEPPPRLVVRVFEDPGLVTVAARDPGEDPLGPPLAGWRWQVRGP